MGLIKTAMMTGGGVYAVSKLAKAAERRPDYGYQPSSSRGQIEPYPGHGPANSYPTRAQIESYPARGQGDAYLSRGQMDYPQQEGYGPPPYQAHQESRDPRNTEKSEAQEQGNWYPANNYSDPRAPYQRADQSGAGDGRWQAQDGYSRPTSMERRWMESHPPYCSTRQPGFVVPLDDERFERRGGQTSSSAIPGMVRMASEFLGRGR